MEGTSSVGDGQRNLVRVGERVEVTAGNREGGKENKNKRQSKAIEHWA